jgi:tRNA(fMet)-specific endonuclease VapC
MASVMLDTNTVSMLMRHPSGPLWERVDALGRGQACMSLITSAELRFGIEKSGSLRHLRAFEVLREAVPVLPLLTPVDTVYGRIRSRLERLGTPIGPNDLWIAAHALALDLTLVTGNVREFSRVPGLRVENWLD